MPARRSRSCRRTSATLVFDTRIKKTVRYAEAPVKGTSVLNYDSDGNAARAYRDLAGEVLRNGKARIACTTARWRPCSGRPTRRGERPRRRPGGAPPERTPQVGIERRAGRRVRRPRPCRPTSTQRPVHAPARRRTRRYLAVIRVVGVGGGGCNAVNRMVEADIGGVEFIAVNTDLAAAAMSRRDRPDPHRPPAHRRASARAPTPRSAGRPPRSPTTASGRRCAAPTWCSSTAGEGGGTGTGAAPVVARIARELGALTVGIVTSPFGFEGNRRPSQADARACASCATPPTR